MEAKDEDPGWRGGVNVEFVEIQAAWEVLKDVDEKAKYDQDLEGLHSLASPLRILIPDLELMASVVVITSN